MIRWKKSRPRPIPPAALLLAALLPAAGCVLVPTKFDPTAFDDTKTYAVVTIASTEEIAQGNKKFSEWLKGDNPARDSQRILEEVRPVLIQALGGTGHFRLLPERQVLRSAAYRGMPPHDAHYMGTDMHVPEGYRFFIKDEEFAALAKGLNVDGVIFVGVNFNVLLKGSSAYGHSYVSIGAFDRDGRTVWRDAVFAQSDSAIGHKGGTVYYEELRPLLLDATDQAAGAIVAKLDQKTRSGESGGGFDTERLR
jgi:hypothetical protein